MQKQYGWGMKGKRHKADKSGKRGKRISLLANQNKRNHKNKFLYPFLIEGYTNKEVVIKYFEKNIPRIPGNSTIIMDNASFHKRKELKNIIEKNKTKLIFLPPYSPDLNPIEQKFAQLKKYIQKTYPQIQK